MEELGRQLHEPFLLEGAGKDYLWGGTRLRDDFSKQTDLVPLAETWECSTHKDGLSIVRSGPFSGETLKAVLTEHPEFVGSHPKAAAEAAHMAPGEIPVLVKFIDAKEDLSVQVHPDDDYARTHENGSLGKTEMWYVVDAAQDAALICGFSRDMDEQTLEDVLREDAGRKGRPGEEIHGKIEKYLQKVPVHRGDVFYITPGTVHAICSGALVVEVQESSNITYRIYDYHRVDKKGRERELHIDKALQVMNRKAQKSPRQPIRVVRYRPGISAELLCRCRYFQTEKIELNTERIRNLVEFRSDHTSFQVLVCTQGCGVLFFGDSVLPFFRGDTIFVPADSVPIKIHGRAEMIRVCC